MDTGELTIAEDSANMVDTSTTLDIADGLDAKPAVETGSAEPTVDFKTPSDDGEELVEVTATEVTTVRKVLFVGGDVRVVYDDVFAGPVTVGYMVITELSTP
jgi:hypothetical protein